MNFGTGCEGSPCHWGLKPLFVNPTACPPSNGQLHCPLVQLALGPARLPLGALLSCEREAGGNHPTFFFYGARQKLHCSFLGKKKNPGRRKNPTKPSYFLEKPSTSHPKKSWMPHRFPASCGCRVVMSNVSQGSGGAVEWGCGVGL